MSAWECTTINDRSYFAFLHPRTLEIEAIFVTNSLTVSSVQMVYAEMRSFRATDLLGNVGVAFPLSISACHAGHLRMSHGRVRTS